MKKNKKLIALVIVTYVLSLIFSGCSNNSANLIEFAGEKVDTRLLNAGFYLDIAATLSDAQYIEALNKVISIERPYSFGEIELPEISEITVETATVSIVTDEMVENELLSKIDKYADFQTLNEKRAAKSGDKVVIDIDGTINGVPFDGGKAENQEVIIGSNEFIPGFEDKIIGHFAGEEFSFEINFPYDYHEESLKGKRAKFKINIRYIQELVKPDFNNIDVLKKYSKTGATNIDEYKKELRDILEFKILYASKEEIKNQALSAIGLRTKGTPSEIAIGWKFSKLLEEQKRYAMIQQISYVDQLANQSGITMREALAQLKWQAYYSIGSDVLLNELAHKYNVKITDKEMREWYKAIETVNEYRDVTYEYYKQSMGDTYVYDNTFKYFVLDEVIKHINVNYLSLEEVARRQEEEQKRQEEMQKQQMQNTEGLNIE